MVGEDLGLDDALAREGTALVDALARLPENQWFDRKSGRVSAKDLARPMIAFANAEGGTIVVGISDGKLDGVSTQLENAARQVPLDFTVPPIRAQFERRQVDERQLLVIHVGPGEGVHTNRAGDCFLRIGDESRRLSLAEQRELTYDRGAKPFDAAPADVSLEALNPDLLEEYRGRIGSSSIPEMLAARDLIDRTGALTVAAALLFDERPQREYPSAHVRVLRYDSDERGVGADMSLVEDIRIDGPLTEQITEATAHIDRLLPHRQQLTTADRFERVPIVPRAAWLEGLVNAVIHRSYSMMGDHIRVEIFPHRIEITSPGRFPGLANHRDPLRITRYARNPRIARVCSDLGITRELGEGIKRIFAEMKRRGLAQPIYRQSSAAVTLILSAADSVDQQTLASLPPNALAALDVLRLENRPLGTGQVADLVGIARPTAGRALRALADVGLVQWEGASGRDPRASWRLL